MAKTLVAGPWLGEFGWELFMWQARIRYLHLNGNYDKVVCIIRNGHELLYDDYSPDYAFLNTQGSKNGWRLNEQLPIISPSIKAELDFRYGDYEIYKPNSSFNFLEQHFVSLKKEHTSELYDIAFHCRSTEKLNTSYRNWEREKWEKIRDTFSGLKIACVGSKEESMAIEGTNDLRGIPLKDLAVVLSNTKLLMGPSSGTMHFGSLCECKHIVFTDKSIVFEGKYTNRYRYETAWNPLHTKAIVLDEEGWRPPVETVIKCIERELA